jgi:predicted transposase/invertase (TIGR01784 family)
MSGATKKARRRHDPIYRRIFNRPQIMKEILSKFASGPWVKHLDFSTLAPVPADFISRYLKKYEGDLIWHVRYGRGPGEWFYIFVLMELQSSVQRFMALRMLGYVVQLCEVLLDHGRYLPQRRPKRLLPPVLPVVLYNGEEPWTAPLSLAELFQKVEGFTPPDFQYIVLDVNNYKPEELKPVETVTSGVFLLEQSKDIEELQHVLDDLEKIVKDPNLSYDIASLVSDLAIKLNLGSEELPRFETLEEVKMSLIQRAGKWTQEWKEEGRKEGHKEGHKEGSRLATAKILKNQLQLRFGALPTWALDRIDRTDVDTLERWAYRVFDATSLEGILGEKEEG